MAIKSEVMKGIPPGTWVQMRIPPYLYGKIIKSERQQSGRRIYFISLNWFNYAYLPYVYDGGYFNVVSRAKAVLLELKYGTQV